MRTLRRAPLFGRLQSTFQSDEAPPLIDDEEAPITEASGTDEHILTAIDNLCDDLFLCKTEVLKQFARTRQVSGSSKLALVVNLLERAQEEGISNTDMKATKKVLGAVFDSRSGIKLRSTWTNEKLEASHVESACQRHLRYHSMTILNPQMNVRANSHEGSRVMRRISRMFQEDFPRLAEAAVGGAFRSYKEEVDMLLKNTQSTDILAAFCSYLITHVKTAGSAALIGTNDTIGTLLSEGVIRPAVEEDEMSTLESLYLMLDDVTDEAQRCEGVWMKDLLHWGSDTGETNLRCMESFLQSARYWELEDVPKWITELSRQFGNWEAVIRNDIRCLTDAPPIVFLAILRCVALLKILRMTHVDDISCTEVPLHYRSAVRLALLDYLHDEDRVSEAIQQLNGFVQLQGQDPKGFRPEFFDAVSSQLQAALQDTDSSGSVERVAIIVREVSYTASRFERVSGIYPLLVRLTIDMRFHLRFLQVFRHLSARERTIVRLRKGKLVRTLIHFEEDHSLTPISVKATAFLVIVMLALTLRSTPTQRSVLERYSSVTGKDEFGLVVVTDQGATRPSDLKVALPPQLSHTSWLSNDEVRSVYKVMPSSAVKGGTNDVMLLSQAPMMKALDVVSRVPWRINRFMLHVQEAIVREGFGFGKIRPAFYPLHYTNMRSGEMHYSKQNVTVQNVQLSMAYEAQRESDWKNLSEIRSVRVHYLQALRQARTLMQFSHLYFPHSMDFRGRMYPIPGRLNHTGSDPFRALLEHADPKPLGKEGLFWLKVHLANKMGQSKLSFDERVQYVDEHTSDVVRSAESPLQGDKWWQSGAEPLQALMACKELSDALKHSEGPEHFMSRIPVAVDGSYNGLQHYSAIGRDEYGAQLVNLIPSERPADAYVGILKEMMKSIIEDAKHDHPVAQRCIGSGSGLDQDHIRRKTIKRPIMTQVYGVTGYGMLEQIQEELIAQNKSHGLWTSTDIKEMAGYVRDKVLESLGITFRETQQCRLWLTEVTRLIWHCQPADLRVPFCWTTPLGLVVRQPYRRTRESNLFSPKGFTKIHSSTNLPASNKQLTAIAPNVIHSMDATHLAMTALAMSDKQLTFMAVHDSFWTHACDMGHLSDCLRLQFYELYSQYDPLWELKEQWESIFFHDLRRHGVKLPDPPKRGSLDLALVKDSKYFFS